MRRPSILVLIAGIIPALSLGCGGSGSGLALDAGLRAGGVAGGTGSGSGQSPGSGGVGGGGTYTGGNTDVLTSAGESAGAAVSASTPTGGAGGIGGVVSNTGGRTGGSTTMGTGGVAGVGGTSVVGESAVAGKTSSTKGGTSTPSGGTTATGGTSNPGGGTGGPSAASGTSSRPGPALPARFVGNLDTRGSIRADFSQYWDQFTPENAGKWPSVQGSSKSTFNWSSLDAMYKYTEEHGIIFKESSFIWGAAQPNWINNSNVMEVAPAWMRTFCERYPNTRLIDVVNEPLHMMPGYATGLGGGGRTTWEWVANSFKMAREACPNAVLIINDYNICEYASDHQNFLAMMKAIQALGAPVDAIGCQGHDAAKVTVSKFKDFIDVLASETGLPIYITEFDIGLADDEAQRVQYADYFTMFWDDPHVKGVTVYGYITGATWRSNTGIMSIDGGMRPAMSWLMTFLGR